MLSGQHSANDTTPQDLRKVGHVSYTVASCTVTGDNQPLPGRSAKFYPSVWYTRQLSCLLFLPQGLTGEQALTRVGLLLAELSTVRGA